jgi:CRISPR-associated endonuclease Csy4
LGETLRLHGTQQALQQLQETDWLKGMRDHTRLTGILPAPTTPAGFYTVKRKQYKSNVERLRRRRMQRKGESHEQAAAAIPVTVEQKPELPYITLRSQSTGQTFYLFIEQGRQNEPAPGSFSCYGLSPTATVPYF